MREKLIRFIGGMEKTTDQEKKLLNEL